jgi:hypothetical protein
MTPRPDGDQSRPTRPARRKIVHGALPGAHYQELNIAWQAESPVMPNEEIVPTNVLAKDQSTVKLARSSICRRTSAGVFDRFERRRNVKSSSARFDQW